MIRVSLLCVLLTVVMTCYGADDDQYVDYYYEESACGHDHFYCDYDDPSIFYRCIDGIFHTFHCPSGLHFSVGTQTCDWPHLADCSSGEGHTEGSSVGHGASNEVGNAHAGGKSTGHSAGQSAEQNHSSAAAQHESFSHSGESSWISQAAAAGKSWWRPEGVNPKEWQDAGSIKKPAFLPHISDDKKEDADQSKKSETKTKSAPQKSSSTGTHAQISLSASSSSASVDRQASSSAQWREGSCASGCQLPRCFCAGSAIPNGLAASSVPQMVMITFDDEVSAAFYGYYQRLFRPGRYNPNGCPVRGCLFVSGSGTEYDLVYPLYAMGVEIASHSISHRFPHTWWASASYQEYVEEASGMKENLVTRSGLAADAVKGFRVPFLQLGSDNMYSALYDSKFVYDSSMFTGHEWEGGEPIWPFTLDYVPDSTFCQHGPCPTKQYPGMWEIPVQKWYGLDGHSCSMADGCTSTGDAAETFEFLKSNFRRYYNSNRAPLGLFVHARWFNTEHNLEGLDRFIDYLLTLDDVYIVTPSQVIEWMKSPTPLSSISGFQPWSCQGSAKDASL